jgi:nicotinate phosphoribosyltransferase
MSPLADALHERPSPWVDEDDLPLLTDLYQLGLVRGHLEAGRTGRAVFDLSVRRLPPSRRFLLACGQELALEALERLRFGARALEHLRGFGVLGDEFLRWLADFRFTGDVRGVPEGTPVFAREPILEVSGPLPEVQLVETLLVNQVHLQTVLASKATRIVAAARGRPVVDFGLKRSHGVDAGIKSARACYIAGLAATSNVLAGRLWGIPVSGTMTHAYVEAHADELDAFRAFAARFGDTTLLVDSHRTLDGVREVIALAEEQGEAFDVRAIRLDPGRDGRLAKEARALLDGAGLSHVDIFASGGLDEHAIDRLIRDGAPIGGFGVGTEMAVPRDAPALDMSFRMASFDGPGELAVEDESVLPGPKQVFRVEVDGVAMRDVIARADEERPGRALLTPLMRGGRVLQGARRALPDIRAAALNAVAALPERVRGIGDDDPAFPVEVSDRLEGDRRNREGAAGDSGAGAGHSGA